MILTAPFPWFGGKRRCAPLVWQRLGQVPNFVEPFAGSLAMMLACPHQPRTETANDKDAYLSNFWRAVVCAPDKVAFYADWPVNEADLHARHRWLVEQVEFRERMMTDPHYFDAKIAGWWVWGISQWIGSGWCSRPEWMGRSLPAQARGLQARERNIEFSNKWRKRPSMGRGGRGVFKTKRQIPDISGNSGASGRGIHATAFKTAEKRPILNQGQKGVLRNSLKMPKFNRSRLGSGVLRDVIRTNLLEYMEALKDRLRCVRICCGDWERVLGPSPTTCIGLTGVFLDPPYGAGAGRDASIYNVDDLQVSTQVREWAIAHGDDRRMRIALCGYEGEHTMPATWECVAWKANGGYGNQAAGRGKENSHRERIWFSPHCLKPGEMLL